MRVCTLGIPHAVSGRMEMELCRSALNSVTKARLFVQKQTKVIHGERLTKITSIEATNDDQLVVIRDEFLEAPLECL